MVIRLLALLALLGCAAEQKPAAAAPADAQYMAGGQIVIENEYCTVRKYELTNGLHVYLANARYLNINCEMVIR